MMNDDRARGAPRNALLGMAPRAAASGARSLDNSFNYGPSGWCLILNAEHPARHPEGLMCAPAPPTVLMPAGEGTGPPDASRGTRGAWRRRADAGKRPARAREHRRVGALGSRRSTRARSWEKHPDHMHAPETAGAISSSAPAAVRKAVVTAGPRAGHGGR